MDAARNLAIFLTRHKSVTGFFSLLYSLVARAAGFYLWMVPGVREVYVRRGVAKGESIPFLSDIDLAVIVDTERARSRARRAARPLVIMRVIEPQLVALRPQDFGELFAGPALAENRGFLFRLYEAPHTWKRLWGSAGDSFDQLPSLNEVELFALALNELLYWHGLWIEQSTEYWLAVHKSTHAELRFAWLLLKATSEIWNLTRYLLREGDLCFSRRRILQEWQQSASDAQRDFLLQSQAFLDGVYPSDRDEYRRVGLAILDDTFLRLRLGLGRRLSSEPGFVDSVRERLDLWAEPQGIVTEDCDLRLPENPPEGLQAVFLTPQLRSDPKGVLVGILFESLSADWGEELQAFVAAIKEQLQEHGTSFEAIEVNIASADAFVCLSAPHKFSLGTRFLVDRNRLHLPSYYELLFSRIPTGELASLLEAGARS